MLETLFLSRLQFAANISFHMIYPTISIALTWMLLFFKLRYNRTGDKAWLEAYGFWVKVFALTFALGVVSGITMTFQFGTNWMEFMHVASAIAGPLLAYEILTAFFLEATFLGIMLYGANRVSNRLHTFSTLLVAVGTTMSAFWILVLNSWMQTPAGFEMLEGEVVVTDWLAAIFNPSMPYRFTHMMLASFLTGSFLIAGGSAYKMLKGDQSQATKKALASALGFAMILTPAQAFVGDLHGLNTLENQPAKIAAIEGIWETEEGAPLLLFALPDSDAQTNHFEIGIPKLASLILTHELDGELQGLNEFAEDGHAPVFPVFWSFRVMVGLGLLMMGVSWLAGITLWRKKSLPRWQLIGLSAMTFAGSVATLAGWMVTEIGRQPWLIHGVLKTADAVNDLPPEQVLVSLITYLTIYAVLLTAYIATLRYLALKSLKPEQDYV